MTYTAQETPHLWFTTFPAPARWTVQGRFESWSWLEIIHHVRAPELWPGAPSIATSEDQLPGWTFARYADDCRVDSDDPATAELRTASRVLEVWGIAVEYVDEPAVDSEHLRTWWGQWRYLAYTTAFNQREMGEKPPGPRWRILIPFSRAATLDEARRIGAWARSPHREAGIADASTERPWRFWAVPAVVPGGYRWDIHEGAFLDPDAALEELARWEGEDATRAARRSLEHTTIGEIGRAWLRRFGKATDRLDVGFDEPDAGPGALLPGPPSLELTWPRLAALIGGTWAGRVGTLVGPQGSGRTAFALQAAEWLARTGAPVLLAPTAQSAQEVLARLLAMRAQRAVSHATILARRVPRTDAEVAVLRLGTDCPHLYLWTRPASTRTPDALRTVTRAVAQSHGGTPPVVVMDSVPLPDEAPSWWDALIDIARPGGLDPDWSGARVLAVSPLPRGANAAFASPASLARWCEEVHRSATALEALDPRLAEAAETSGLLLGLTVDPSAESGRRDALVAVLANRHGRRDTVPFVHDPTRGTWLERDLAASETEPRLLESHAPLLLTGPRPTGVGGEPKPASNVDETNHSRG